MKKRNRSDESLGAGQDSFLDVVANIVGILIILTAIVGARVQHAVAHPEETLQEPKIENSVDENLARQFTQSVEEAQALEQQALETRNTLLLLEAQNEALNKTRQEYTLGAATVKKEIEAKREKLSAEEKEKFDLQQKISLNHNRIQELEKSIGYEKAQKKPDVKKLECYPTAISKPVDKSEVWIQVKNGRIAFIPSERLLDGFRKVVNTTGNGKTMFSGGRVTATIGPFDGFLLEGTAWMDHPPNVSVDVKFVPLSAEVGETVDDALKSPDSIFLAELKKNNPRLTVITVWVYEDSFMQFQDVEKYLYESGYRVASRPLPNGVPIGAGPNGSRSAAQ